MTGQFSGINKLDLKQKHSLVYVKCYVYVIVCYRQIVRVE